MKIVFDNDVIVEVKGEISDKMTEDEFFDFCQLNREIKHTKIERLSNSEIIIIAPSGFPKGFLNPQISGALFQWNQLHGLGKGFGYSVGFTLKDNSVFAPDNSWVHSERLATLTKADYQKFARVCPNFVAELKMESDSFSYLKNKMTKWIENGCELAWLIIPEKEEAHIYRADGSIEIVKGFNKKLSGENILPGFEFDLSLLK